MKNIKCIGFSLFAFLLFVGSANAWGFRPMAMGGAFTAVADDANCAYWNSAVAAQLDNFKDGESQIAVTSRILDEVGILNRNSYKGDTYYDSFNFVKKVNNHFGWSIAGEWSGGGAIGVIPGAALKLPWNDKMSIGIGFFIFKKETTRPVYVPSSTYDSGTSIITFPGYYYNFNKSYSSQGINLDYLWKFRSDWSFGVHGENIFQIANDSDGISLLDKMNLQPGIAWIPKDRLNGLIVNFGIYDLLNKLGNSPFISLGAEYTVRPKSHHSSYPQSSFRAGINQIKSLTLGYGFKINALLEIGYLGVLNGGKHNHNIGVSFKF